MTATEGKVGCGFLAVLVVDETRTLVGVFKEALSIPLTPAHTRCHVGDDVRIHVTARHYDNGSGLMNTVF